jgi:hypothetical protein
LAALTVGGEVAAFCSHADRAATRATATVAAKDRTVIIIVMLRYLEVRELRARPCNACATGEALGALPIAAIGDERFLLLPTR